MKISKYQKLISKSFWRRKRKMVERDPGQISKSFWRRKRKKHQYHHEGNKNLSEEQKQKQVEYIRNHYVTN